MSKKPKTKAQISKNRHHPISHITPFIPFYPILLHSTQFYPYYSQNLQKIEKMCTFATKLGHKMCTDLQKLRHKMCAKLQKLEHKMCAKLQKLGYKMCALSHNFLNRCHLCSNVK